MDTITEASPEAVDEIADPPRDKLGVVFRRGVEFNALGVDLVIEIAHRKGLVIRVKDSAVDPRERGFTNGRRLRFGTDTAFVVASVGRHGMQLKCAAGTRLHKRKKRRAN